MKRQQSAMKKGDKKATQRWKEIKQDFKIKWPTDKSRRSRRSDSKED